MKREFCLVVVFSAVCLVLGGCATVADKYRDTQSADTVAAYDRFVKAYPNSPFTEEARKRLEELKTECAFLGAEARNSIAAYTNFLLTYPSAGTALTEEAKKRIAETDGQAFQRTCFLATPEAFQGFVESYPGSKYKPLAEAYIQFAAATASGTLDAYKRFITQHPDNPFACEAKASFLCLWLNCVTNQNVGVVLNVRSFQRWRGIFGGGKASEAEVCQKAYAKMVKELEKQDVASALCLCENETAIKPDQYPVALLVDYREDAGEHPRSSGYSRPAGPGLAGYTAQQLNQAAADNLASVFSDILIGPQINVSAVVTVKDTRTGWTYYRDAPGLAAHIGKAGRVRALVLFGKAAVPALMVALHDKDVSVQDYREYRAALADRVSAQSPTTARIVHLETVDTSVQKAAVDALRVITGQDFGADLAQWRRWWEAGAQ